MLAPFATPLALEGFREEWMRSRAGAGIATDARHAGVGLRSIVLQGLFVGALFTAILLFRSRASLDFIYFQF
jgi:hypothetical protein